MRVEDARSTPTSRICLRPSVLDRQPVMFQGVEASKYRSGALMRRSARLPTLTRSIPSPLQYLRYQGPSSFPAGGGIFPFSRYSRYSTGHARNPHSSWGGYGTGLKSDVAALRRHTCKLPTASVRMAHVGLNFMFEMTCIPLEKGANT